MPQNPSEYNINPDRIPVSDDPITEGVSFGEQDVSTDEEKAAQYAELDKFDDETLGIVAGLGVAGLLAVIGTITIRNLKRKGNN